MSDKPLASRLSTIKSKAVTITVNEVKTPDCSTDVLSLYRANSSARMDNSNEWIIDVFPNFTPIIMYTMLMSTHHANTVNHREHSKSSVATICMYYMTVVYGFFLLNDLYVRPTPSAHARSWAEISWKREFTDYLLSLPVPEFLIPILSQFHSFQTEKSPNVFFVPSAAGFDHDQFFGRVFPLNMFAAIHDCAATLPGNSTRIEVLRDLYTRVLYTITAPGYSCLIPDLVGVTINQGTTTTANYINSRLYQVFTSMFNPVLFRDQQRRSTLAALSFNAPTYPTNQVNAYDLLFSATAANLRELKVILQAVTAVLSDAVPFKTSLSKFISDATASSILKHGYSTYALPTWSHTEIATKEATFLAITHHTLITEEARAQDFCFLALPDAAIPHRREITDVTYGTTAAPETAVALPANHTLYRRFPWCLRHNTEQDATWPSHEGNDLVGFSEETDVVPSVLVLDTDGASTMTAHLATIAGKIIESFELDGSTVEMPNALKSLGMQNCMFADSAIAYKYVRPGSYYRPRTAGSVLPPLNRVAPNSRPRLPAASLLHDRTLIMLPRFNPTINERADHTTLPGMTQKSPAGTIRYNQSFLGFRTVDRSSNAVELDAVPAMVENQLMVWSPYTYTPFESENHPFPDFADSRHYYLTNLRTFFGTDYNLVQVKHPYEAFPVV
nr:coat protein [Partitiviridae sp.]